ncbi:MAG: DMT family transporter [Burkholderiaceae bacterium]
MTSAAAGPRRWPAVLALLVNAAIWGCSWWPFRQLLGLGVHPLLATSLVFVVGSVVVALYRRRSLAMMLASPGCWAIALASGLTNGGFNWAVTLGPVVRVVLLFYLMPVWAALLARWMLGERLDVAAVVRIALGLAGAVFVLWQPGAGLPLPERLSEWLALGGGVGFALVNVLLRRFASVPTDARVLAMFVGCAACLLPLGIARHLLDPDASALVDAWIAGAPLIVAMLAGLAVLLLSANLALQYGAARLPTNLASVIMLSEIVFATVSAIWWDGEALTPRILAGGAMILGSALLAARSPH